MKKRYINHDERFGAEVYAFTLPEMIAQYRDLGWDEYEDDNGIIVEMSDDEIIDDILDHDIEEV
jgi:hypothetical protein